MDVVFRANDVVIGFLLLVNAFVVFLLRLVHRVLDLVDVPFALVHRLFDFVDVVDDLDDVLLREHVVVFAE